MESNIYPSIKLRVELNQLIEDLDKSLFNNINQVLTDNESEKIKSKLRLSSDNLPMFEGSNILNIKLELLNSKIIEILTIGRLIHSNDLIEMKLRRDGVLEVLDSIDEVEFIKERVGN